MFFLMLLESAVLSATLSADALAAGFAYGSRRVHIPVLSACVVTVICSAVLGLSLLAGAAARPHLPQWLTVAVCFGILFILGVVKLLDGVTKSIIAKYNKLDKKINFSFFNFKFILHLYAHPEDADLDASERISPGEAAALAVSLSLDGLAVGFGAAMGQINGWAAVGFSLVLNAAAILLGAALGRRLAHKRDVSWLGGAVLIVLAATKLF